MAFLDNILGVDEVFERMEEANEAARERFDPTDLDPQLRRAQDIAVEGIDDENIRESALQRIFASGNISDDLGGNLGTGRALSFLQRMDESRRGQLAQTETKIGLAEEKAKRTGEDRVAEIQTQQEKIESQREARIRENRVKAEAEADRRRRSFGTALGKFAGVAAAAIPGVGPLGAAAIGGGAGLLGGGGQGAVAGGISGVGASADLGRAQEKSEAEQFMEFLRDRTMDRFVSNETENARATATSAPEDEIIPADIDTSLDVDQGQVDFLDRLIRGETGFFRSARFIGG